MGQKFLDTVVWEAVKDAALCHDSVSCEEWSGSVAFPVLRKGLEYLGAHFDTFGRPRDSVTSSLPGNQPDKCNVQS